MKLEPLSGLEPGKGSKDSTTELLTLLYSNLSNIIAFEHYEIRKYLMNDFFLKDGKY